MKGLTAAVLLAISGSMASAAKITILQVFPSDGNGNARAVNLGEPFYLTAKLNVENALNGVYRVRFDLPYGSRITPNLNFEGRATVAWGPFTALTAEPMTAQVSVDAPHDGTGQSHEIRIQPALPNTALDYFTPQSLSGSVGAFTRLTGGNATGIQWYSPVPMSGGFQQVLSAGGLGMMQQSLPYGQAVLSTPRRTSTEVQFATRASSSRVNPSLLRSASFAQYKPLSSDVAAWLEPEALVQSRSGEVSAFVSATLPTNYRAALSPYDAAQRLFQRVVAKIQYVDTVERPDAVTAARTNRGDCGYFSALFVAACRNAGIPARTVTGMTLGENEWHVWAEFYIPNGGWIPADPAFCDTICPDGSLPLYFGTIPELNERVAVSYGFDHTISRSKLNMLQSPTVVTSGLTRVAPVQPYCKLVRDAVGQ